VKIRAQGARACSSQEGPAPDRPHLVLGAVNHSRDQEAQGGWSLAARRPADDSARRPLSCRRGSAAPNRLILQRSALHIIFRGRDSQCHPSNTQAVYLDVHIAFLCTRLDHGCDRGFLGSWLDLRTGPLPQKTDSEGRALQKPAARGTFPGS